MYGQGMNFSNWLCGAGGFMPGPLGMVVTFLFWALVIYLIVKIFGYFFPSISTRKTEESPNAVNILKTRYAAGEISRTEFEQMKNDIA